jgi:transposase
MHECPYCEELLKDGYIHLCEGVPTKKATEYPLHTKVCCHRCGWEGIIGDTQHTDGVYCPNCESHKDDHASLSILD